MSKQIKSIDCPILEFDVANINEVAKAVGAAYFDGVWWKQLRRGFWWPFDFSSPLDSIRTPPKLRYWGYQYLIDSKKKNSYLRFLFIDDLQNYGSHSLATKARNQTRKSYEKIEIRKIEDFNEKEAEEARICWNDLVRRTDWRQRMTKDSFLRYWKSLLSLKGHNILGAFYEGLLVGWLVGILIDNGNCYLTRYASLEEFLKYRINNGLVYTFVISAKNKKMKTANFGLHIPERVGLDKFKQNMGFQKAQCAAYTYLNPILKPVLITFYRKQINRLTGWDSS